MSAFIVGLTGGIGSGKTTVANLFHQLGIQSVDADIVAREVVEPGTPCLQCIVEHFGPAILQADGQLNRAALREIIFSQPEQKTWLNNLLHPAIRQQLLQQLAALTSPYALLIAPLLLENGLNHYVQRVLVVDLPERLQIARTLQRDQVSEQQVAAIIATQLPRAERLKRADDVVVNDQTADVLQQQVQALHQFYLQQAEQLKNTIPDN